MIWSKRSTSALLMPSNLPYLIQASQDHHWSTSLAFQLERYLVQLSLLRPIIAHKSSHKVLVPVRDEQLLKLGRRPFPYISIECELADDQSGTMHIIERQVHLPLMIFKMRKPAILRDR